MGIEPTTNSLEGCDSTTELLPPFLALSRQLPAVSRICLHSHTKANARSTRVREIQTLEPMTRIELVTSPLPRECSTN